MQTAGTYKITRQGQITIPKEARKLIGLAEGDLVDVFFTPELLVIKKRREPVDVFEDLAEIVTERFQKEGITREQVEEEISRARAERRRKKA